MRPTSLQHCSPSLQESLFHTCVCRTRVHTHVNYRKNSMDFYVWFKVIKSTCIAKARRKLAMEILGRTMNILRFCYGVQGRIMCPMGRIIVNSLFLQWFNGKMKKKWISVLYRISKSPWCVSSGGWSREDERCDKEIDLNIKTCILSRVKQITSPGWMHETSAWTWCTGKTQRNWVEREVGGGIGMGNTCKSMADSCQCMTKTTTIL